MPRSEEGTIGVDGTIEWRDADDRLDRFDGPAASYPDECRIWFLDGEIVRREVERV